MELHDTVRPMIDWLEIVLRLAAALVAGGAIGLNRDMHGKPTGVRLHAMVAVGAATLVMAGQFDADPGARSRIVQGIVGGIGFLGAGVIMRGGTRTRRSIQHLTTAASIWVTAALGVACGIGAWMLSFLSAAAILFVLVAGFYIDKWLYGVFYTEGRDDHDPISP